MARPSHPVTPAVRALRQAKISFAPHLYDYVPRGGTRASSAALGVDEHAVVKTLVMADEKGQPLIVLMHGDLEVSTKNLARAIGVKRVSPCEPAVAHKHTGYQVGGTSPFGTRRQLPVYVEATILDLETLYINGGKRGFLVALRSDDLRTLLSPVSVQVGISGR